jgi:O-antigen ligase
MQILAIRAKVCNWLFPALVVMGSLTIGWAIAQGQFLWLSVLGFVVTLGLCLVRPVLASSFVMGFTFINPNLLPPIAEVGQFTIRYVDGATVLSAVVIFLRLAVQRSELLDQEWWIIFKPLFPFLVYVGMSIGLVWVYVPDVLEASFASYARLMVTVLLGLLIYMNLRHERDVRLFTRLIVVFAVPSIIVGTWEALASSQREAVATSRYGGLLGINTLGLVAGLMVLWAVIACMNRGSMLSWVVMLIVGLLGLFLSKSVSSTLATIWSILFFWIVFSRRKRSARSTWPLWLVLGGVVGIALAMWALWLLRPSDFYGLVNLAGGSLSQRVMIAYGALLIFLSHPLFGVGWQASSTEALIGDQNLNEVLMRAFPQLPAHYFFLERPTSLHNLYMQLLAELGIVGFLLFIYGVVRVWKEVAGILRRIPHPSPFRRIALFSALGLVYLLIWWNTNPLFGGQTESILAVTFLSLLAALWRVQRRNYKCKEFENF